jgi:hypothetical protein
MGTQALNCFLNRNGKSWKKRSKIWSVPTPNAKMNPKRKKKTKKLKVRV